MTPRFVHLHVHSEFSLRDSTARLPEKPEYGDPKKAPRPNLVSRAVELAQPALALTDLSNFFGLVKFYRAAEKMGIKPIAGADVLLEHGSDIARLTLLCQNRSGYLGLSRLLSRAYLEGHHGDHVAIRPEWLQAETKGLIVIAGRESPVGKVAIEGHLESAEHALRELQRHFPDRVYVELTRTGRRHEEEFNAAAIDLAARCGLPLLASNDVRFLDRADFEAHEARVCIASGWILNDPRRPHDYSAEQYLKSEEEMCTLFADLPEALANSVELAKRCNLELEFGRNYLPAFPVPAEHTLDSWMRRQSHEGLEQRLTKQSVAEGFTRADYMHRLDQELSVIIQMDFAGYFLIVADFINWAKQNAIPVGPGRGSGAGSLVAYALGITDLDPIRYDLLFERFLNPERVSMPDFDIDFCMVRRDEVIDYVAQKYGRDHVSQIITYGTMAAKAVVRDAGRVLGMPHGQVDRIAKMIPLRPTDPLSLDDALGRSDRARADSGRIVAEFKEAYETDDEIRDLVDLAVKLEDLTRNAGKHAGGVVIAPSPLTDFAALFAEQGSRGAVTQFDKDDIEAVGLVKFDFLGLRTLTIIDWAIKAIGIQSNGQMLDIMSLPLDDKPTYELLSRGETTAVFQFESRGMRDYIRKLKPERFDDLVALAALYRPGPLNSGMVDDFIDRRHGRAEVSYPHELLEPILKPTYGVIVYQEQVMQIAQTMAGYSLGGADLLRRAMGKKKPEEMAKERVKFESGAATNNIQPRLATQIFDLMEKFAEYGFNKSHSAAYALIAYQTAWLKAHYPAEFMAATLSADMDSTDKIVSFLQDARAIGLTVLPPDVNSSGYRFIALPERRIRYGLGAVKGVGEGACEAIVRERERGGPYTDLLDFCERTGGARMNRRTIEALVQAGALDALARNRPSLLLQLPEVLKATEQLARERESGQSSLFGGGTATTTSRIALPDADNWALEQQLAGEYATLGHYLSGHPLDPHRAELLALTGCTLADLDRVWRERRDRRGEASVVLAGIVGLMRRRGDAQAFAQFEDGYGQIEVSFWGETFSQSAPLLTRGRILLIEGGLREDEYTGGFSLRAKQCWDFQQLCAQQARRLSLVADLRERGTLEKIENLLAQFRPGGTPLRLSLRTETSRGTLDLNGGQSVRADPQLLGRLRALPGVSEVALQLARPWGESR